MSIHHDTTFWIFYISFETILYIDMILCFCKVPEGMVNPTFWKTSKNYILKGHMLLDVLSTVVCDTILFVNHDSVWAWRVKVVCVCKASEVKSAYMFLINNYVNTNAHTKRLFKSIANIILVTTIGVHLATCLWIKIGGWDIHLPPDQRNTWLYLKSHTFSKDSRSIYD